MKLLTCIVCLLAIVGSAFASEDKHPVQILDEAFTAAQ